MVKTGGEVTEFTDEKVRYMLSRAGFDCTQNDDVAAFGRFMRAMFAEYEAHQRMRDSRRTTLTLIAATLASAFVTTLIPYLAHHWGFF